MTSLAYIELVNNTARHILLVALFWLLACGAAFAGQDGATAQDDFCGPSDRQEIRCPKTSASICVCYMRTKASQAEMQLKEVTQSVVTVKLPRPARRCRVLPESTQLPLATLFAESVPTRPPRS